MSHSLNDKPLMATDLVAYLQEKHLVDEAAALAVAEERLNYNPFPLYLRILIGIGAVISSGLLLIFLGIAGLFEEASNLLVLGIAMLGVAIYVHLRSRDRDPSTVSFVAEQQLSFLGVFTGKILIVTGAAMRDQALGVFIATLAFTLVTYWVYDLYLDRLASCAGTLVSSVMLLIDKFDWALDNGIAILVHLMVPLGLAIYLHPRIKQAYNPLAIALLGVAAAFSLGAMLDGYLEMLAKEVWEHEISLAGLLTVMITCCSFIGLAAWACGGRDSLTSRYVIATTALTLLLGLASLTSTMIGMIVIILGYVCHDRLIALVGAIFLPATLWLAIHSLEMGLMMTGIVLVVASLVLLAGYFLFRYWSFGDDPEDGSPRIAGEVLPHA